MSDEKKKNKNVLWWVIGSLTFIAVAAGVIIRTMAKKIISAIIPTVTPQIGAKLVNGVLTLPALLSINNTGDKVYTVSNLSLNLVYGGVTTTGGSADGWTAPINPGNNTITVPISFDGFTTIPTASSFVVSGTIKVKIGMFNYKVPIPEKSYTI